MLYTHLYSVDHYWWKRLVSHQRCIWGICCAQMRKLASKGIHLGFETQGRRHQKSKTGVSMAPKKGLVSYKKFNNNKNLLIFYNLKTFWKYRLNQIINSLDIVSISELSSRFSRTMLKEQTMDVEYLSLWLFVCLPAPPIISQQSALKGKNLCMCLVYITF